MFPVDIGSLTLPNGELPPRPASLRAPTGNSNSTTDMLSELLLNRKVAAFGGISIKGEMGYFVPMIGVFQLDVESLALRGWLMRTHPENSSCNFRFIDTSKEPLSELPFPNTMVYFVGESDEAIINSDARQDELLAIARFIPPFISDEGPPAGIDWFF